VIGHVANFYAPIRGLTAPTSARSRAVKGHETTLHAAAILLRTRPEARFVLAGATYGDAARAYRATLVALAQRLGIAHAVTFTWCDDVPDLLATCDVAVQPSRCENLGGTIEALFMGVPTVATRIGGMPEAVIDGRTGLLVEPDDPRQLAAAIGALLDDPGMASALAAAGRRHALANLTLDRTISELDRVLRKRHAERVQTTATIA
jgi:glycosyltransferase involved in cell wall biosynthesis